MASWTWVPPASTGYQEEGAGFLPFGRYRMPDGSQQVSFGLPQGLLDAYRGMRQGLGFEQDPNAPQGYIGQNAMIRAAMGGSGAAMTGTVSALGAGAARAAAQNAMARRGTVDAARRIARLDDPEARARALMDAIGSRPKQTVDNVYHATSGASADEIARSGFQPSRGRHDFGEGVYFGGKDFAEGWAKWMHDNDPNTSTATLPATLTGRFIDSGDPFFRAYHRAGLNRQQIATDLEKAGFDGVVNRMRSGDISQVVVFPGSAGKGVVRNKMSGRVMY